MSQLRAVLLLFVLTFAPGCATLTSLEDPIPFSGTLTNAWTLRGTGSWTARDEYGGGVPLVALFDLPFSFVADLLFLPYTVIGALIEDY